jgi:drug/metabolite transporter (DMT)-like permease
MVIIWGANFSVVKYALREFPQLTFNAARLVLASAVFLVAIRLRHGGDAALSRGDWVRIAVLGLIGHLLYQLAFVAGLARTTASNSALIFGTTPIAVALMSAAAGYERVTLVRWVGAALSMLGIYALVGLRASWSTATLAGDLLIFGGMLCWSIYSVVSQPLLARHSPLVVTGYSMAIGAALYVALAAPSVISTDWSAISALSWALMALSALLALALAYMIWYTSVQRIGSARTAVYSNLTPIVAMIVAAIWLREPIGVAQVVGAVTILGGVFVSRLGAAR